MDIDVKKKIFNILKIEFALHPELQPVDLCKLCAQASRGADHILEDRKKFQEDLENEFETVDESSDLKSPLLQPIDPVGHVFRLHLSPLKRSKLEKDRIIKLLASQKLLKRGEDYALWLKEIMTGVIREHFKNIDADLIDDLFLSKKVFRHSKSYGYTSYRVINDIEAKEFRFLKKFIGHF